MVKPETGARVTVPLNSLRRAAQVAAVTALRTAASELRSPTLWTAPPATPADVADWLDRRAELLNGHRLLDPPADALAQPNPEAAPAIDRDPAGPLGDGGAALADVESSAVTEALATSNRQTHAASVAAACDRLHPGDLCIPGFNHPAAAQ